VLHVRRVKNGTPSTHPIQGDELRALRRLQRDSPSSPFVFVSERGSPFSTGGFARMIERAAAAADLELKAHPHMLRHACGYALANKGHDTRAIQGWLGARQLGESRPAPAGAFAQCSTAIELNTRRAGQKAHPGEEWVYGRVCHVDRLRSTGGVISGSLQ
jgi:hypothetical protein